MIFLSVALIASGELSFRNNARQVIEITPDKNSGLSKIFVLYSAEGTTMTWTSTAGTVEWGEYSNLGAGHSTPVADVVKSGNDYSVTLPPGDRGYRIVDGGRQHFYYIIDYSLHRFTAGAIEIDPQESDCDMTALSVTGNGSPIFFYTVNGRRMEIPRDITLRFSTLTYNPEGAAFMPAEVTDTLSSFNGLVRTRSPLCGTSFCLTGDRFLKEWGESRKTESPFYQPTAVSAHTSMTSNQSTGGSSLPATQLSGPVEATFTAAVTDAVVYHEWQIATDPEFMNIDLRYNETEFTHSFDRTSTNYIRFLASNPDNSCTYESEPYLISIGESSIVCPNAFFPSAAGSPHNEWKITYSSLTAFECQIFNRWGIKVFSFNDPSKGWDGKYRGRLVDPGVYYYVIKARGTDGKDYSLSGSINIINSKSTQSN